MSPRSRPRPGSTLPGRWHTDPLLAEERAHLRPGARGHGDARGLLLEVPRPGAGPAWFGLGDAEVVAAQARALASAPDFTWPEVATLPPGAWDLLDGHRPPACGPQASYSAWEWHLLDREPARPARWQEVVELHPADDETDYHDLAGLRALVLPDSYLPLDSPGARWFGWRDDAGVLRALGGARGWDRYAHLGSIGTEPAWQGRGLGAAVTAALAHAGSSCGPVSLSVYSSNRRALALYERIGFVPVHRFVTRRHRGSLR